MIRKFTIGLLQKKNVINYTSRIIDLVAKLHKKYLVICDLNHSVNEPHAHIMDDRVKVLLLGRSMMQKLYTAQYTACVQIAITMCTK